MTASPPAQRDPAEPTDTTDTTDTTGTTEATRPAEATPLAERAPATGPPAAPGLPAPLLSVQDLRVDYHTRSGVVAAVEGVSLTVMPGEVVAIVGESGSGKSTTAHAVLGLLPAGGRVEQGRIIFDGQDLTRLDERRMRAVRGAGIGLVPQDPLVSLNPVQRVGAQVAEVLRIHGLSDRRGAGRDAVDALRRAGLPDPEVRARQYPHELSGGMRQRVLIAIAVAARPRLVVADEPTSALDVTVQRQILDHVDALVRDRGTAVLLVTHDLGVAQERARRIVVLSKGRIVEAGPADQIVGAPTHSYTRQLVASAPSLSAGRLLARPRARSEPPSSGRPRPHDPAVPTSADPAASAPPVGPACDQALVVVENLVKAFPVPRAVSVGGGPAAREVRAVDGVSFTIPRGETFALVGESGSGKSTTARLVLALARPTSGRILVGGQDVAGLTGSALRAFRRQAQIVYQNPYASLDPRFTVEDVVAEPLRVFRVGDRADRRARVRELVDRVALPESVLARRPPELSGGQRQRVAIARALALAPDLVVCDEPVSALDVSVQAQVLELLARLQADLGLTYLFISHDLAVVRRIADQVGVMRAGHLVETGTADDIFLRPEHVYTRRLLDAIPGRHRAEVGKLPAPEGPEEPT